MNAAGAKALLFEKFRSVMHALRTDQRIAQCLWFSSMVVVAVYCTGDAQVSRDGTDGWPETERHGPKESGLEIPGLSFRVFVD